MLAESNRINKTGRKRIPRSAFRVSLWQEAGKDGDPEQQHVPVCAFQLNEVARSSLLEQFPAQAEVILEARNGPQSTRFLFGTLGDCLNGVARHGFRKQGESIRLDFATNAIVTFRLKFVDSIAGKLYGSQLKIRPTLQTEKNTGKTPLLPVGLKKDMGNQLWKVDFVPEPVLFVNRDYVSSMDQLPPLWKASVIPQTVHRVLSHAFVAMRNNVPTWAISENGGSWLTFIEKMLHVTCPFPSQEEIDAQWNDDPDEYTRAIEQWIEDAVEAFAGFMQTHGGISFKKLFKSEN